MDRLPWVKCRRGCVSVVYAFRVLSRARRQRSYQPVLEDWIWHVVLPLLAYGVLCVTGLLLARWATWAPFGVAASALLLLFVGIHNAWDTVTYVTVTASRAERKDD